MNVRMKIHKRRLKRVRKKEIRRKLRYIPLVIIFTIMVSSALIFRVNAGTNDSTLTREFSGYYVGINVNESSILYNFNVYLMNDKPVYCIELGTDITGSTYNSTTDLSKSGLTSEQMEYVKLLSYYGYEYGSHRDDIIYYLATQELIWRYLSGAEIYWTERLSFPVQKMNIESYKDEILSLVNEYKLTPVISSEIDAYVGDRIELDDKNNVLSDYYVENSGYQKVTISNNKLIIDIDREYIGEDMIRLTRKEEYNCNITLFYYESSQKMISPGTLDKKSYDIKLNINGASLDIYKYDKDNNSNVSQGEASLEKAEYELYDSKNKLVTKFITDDEAHSFVDNLALGTYYIKERSPSLGYLLNDEVEEVVIDKPNNLVILYEEVIKSKIEILKLYGNKNSELLNPESNIIFNVYDKDGNLFTFGITDNNGECSFYLPYGIYTIKQGNTTPGYDMVADFDLVIDEDSDEIIRYNFFNREINPYLRIIKVDSESHLPILSDLVSFKIKNLSTNQYLSYYDKYSQSTIDTFSTDSNGEVIIPIELGYGKYELDEIEVPSQYKKSNTIIEIGKDSNFYYKEDYGYVVDAVIYNELVKGKISINKTGDKFIMKDGSFYYDKVSLEDVKFNLYANSDIVTLDMVTHYINGELITSVKTDNDGKVTIDDLYQGDYCLVEVETNDSYVLNNEPYCFTLEELDYNVSLSNILKTGGVNILKTDDNTGIPLKGAIIELYTVDDILINTSMSNDDGVIKIDKLPLGSYYIKEKKAPDNYNLDDSKYYFTIEDENEVINLNITNFRVPETRTVNTGVNVDSLSSLGIFLVIVVIIIGGVVFMVRKVKI